MASKRFNEDLAKQGFALDEGECFVTLQHLSNLMWDKRIAYTDRVYHEPTLKNGKLFTDEVMTHINNKTISIYSPETLSVIEDIREFTPDVLFKFCQVMSVLNLNPSYVVLAFVDVPIPLGISGKEPPIPIKRSFQSMLDWISYKRAVTPSIRQCELIKEAHEKYGYAECGTAVKRACKKLRLAENDKRT
ncbi:hypothetical protein [Thiothrix eikelboomii]|uniref:hypothetical protein n=1 Tax=Thiothrix eikelboomii TaxID=92487 RepID=UPI003BAEF27D